VDRLLPGADGRHPRRPGRLRRRAHARGDPQGRRLPHLRDLAQWLDPPRLRVQPGLRGLPQPAGVPDPGEPPPRAAGRLRGRHRPGHDPLGDGVPAVAGVVGALVPLPAPDGRPPVRLRRGLGAVRDLLLRHLRQLDPLGRSRGGQSDRRDRRPGAARPDPDRARRGPRRGVRRARPRGARPRRLRRGHDHAVHLELPVPDRAGRRGRHAEPERGSLADAARPLRPAAARGRRRPLAPAPDPRRRGGRAASGTRRPALRAHRPDLGPDEPQAAPDGLGHRRALPPVPLRGQAARRALRPRHRPGGAGRHRRRADRGLRAHEGSRRGVPRAAARRLVGRRRGRDRPGRARGAARARLPGGVRPRLRSRRRA